MRKIPDRKESMDMDDRNVTQLEIDGEDCQDLSGTVHKVVFHNPETGYMVLAFEIDGSDEETTVVGTMFMIEAGDYLKLSGKWISHQKFGRQFQVKHFQPVIPVTEDGIASYLASSRIPHLGPVTAKRLVEHFGLQTLEIIDSSPEKLSEVPGIGAKRARMIEQSWKKNRLQREAMVFLLGHGISISRTNKILQKYGDNAISVVRKNPYLLSMDIEGIGFLTADRIARIFGIPEDSIFRFESGIIHCLQEAAGEGHTYLPLDILMTRCEELLDKSQDTIQPALDNLEKQEKIYIDRTSVPENPQVYIRYFHVAETSSASKLKQLLLKKLTIREVDLKKAVQWVENQLQFRLAQKQKVAIRYSLTHKVMILTGGPGTGKTTTITSIVRVHKALKRRILLAAPTGRAAKRLSEVAEYEARTIHRLLEYNRIKGGFLRNEENPLEGDLIIIDESSMIDILLFHHLMNAVPQDTSLIFVGDINQLPSVGPGNVLRDLIQSGNIPVVELDEIFRQAQKSLIVTNAHRINWGEMPSFQIDEDKQLSDFYFVKETDPHKVLDKIVTLITDRIPKRFGFHPVHDIQVLSPMNKGVTGVYNLNELLQSTLNPRGNSLKKGNKLFRLHDKVMQIRNDYDKEIFNGDIGTVIVINEKTNQLAVLFDQREIHYTYEELDDLVLSYAISVHKSQGCEFTAIILPLLTQHYMMLQRNLLYTGITRGKKLVVIIGTPRAVAMAVKNDHIQMRYSHLGNRIRNVMLERSAEPEKF